MIGHYASVQPMQAQHVLLAAARIIRLVACAHAPHLRCKMLVRQRVAVVQLLRQTAQTVVEQVLMPLHVNVRALHRSSRMGAIRRVSVVLRIHRPAQLVEEVIVMGVCVAVLEIAP